MTRVPYPQWSTTAAPADAPRLFDCYTEAAPANPQQDGEGVIANRMMRLGQSCRYLEVTLTNSNMNTTLLSEIEITSVH